MTQAPQPGANRRVSLERVEQALLALNLDVRNRGGRALMAQCPVHAEKTGSLSVSWVDDPTGGRVLLNCWGCGARAPEITEALGLSLGDLFDEPLPERDSREYQPGRAGRSYRQRKNGQRRGKLGKLPNPIVQAHRGEDADADHEHQWELVRTYPYYDAEGTLVQEVLREECQIGGRHKQFRQLFVVDGRQRKTKPDGFSPVLYRHPQVLEAVAEGNPVWVLEGEKDVETAEAEGLVATTNTQGGRSFPTDLAPVFSGAVVRVVLDRDEAGWDRGVSLHEQLTPLAAGVRLFLPATEAAKSDFTDHIEAGHSVDELIEVSINEVASWARLTKLRRRHESVEKALAETLAQHQLAEDLGRSKSKAKKAEELGRFAQRWAKESEIRCEDLSEQLQELQQVAHQAGSEWADRALDEAEELSRQALTAARTAHYTVGLALPPLLQQSEPVAVKSATEGASQEAVTAGEVPGSAGELEGSADQGSGQAASQGAGLWSGAGRVQVGVSIDQPVFRIVEGKIVMVDRGRRKRNDAWDEEDDENLKLILGLDVRIVEMEYLEDSATDDVEAPQLMGRESSKEQEALNPAAPQVLAAVVISFTDPASGERMMLRVKADDWNSGVWLDSLPGQPDYDAKPSGIALIKRAVKAVSENIRTTKRHRWTGWRRDEDGQWMFVHARGAITPEGARPVPVLLTGPLARYDLPDPTQDPQVLRAAFTEGSASFLTKMPVRVAAPLLGHVYRSAVGVNPWVLALVGSPGSYKTSVASLGMHHWGELWDRRKPATSMSGNGSTMNALRIQLHLAKDALFWADDVAPTQDWGLAQRQLEMFARMVHNAEERTRAERDGQGVMDGTAPRASAMVTSEVMPRPGSGGQRMLVVPFRKEDMDLPSLIELDAEAARHQRALLMSSFLQWLSGRIDEVRSRMEAEVGLYAEHLRESGESDRMAESVANTWAGWLLMTEFLLEVGALSAAERDEVLAQVDHGLKEALVAAVDPDIPTRTGARVRELLAHALRTGVAYVDDVQTGECPEWPLAGRLGWRRQPVGTDMGGAPKYRYEGRGIKLGWVLTDEPTQGERCQQLYVESTAALEQVIQAVAKQMTDAPQLDRLTAIKALHEEGILVAEERAGRSPRYTVQRSIPCEGARKRVTVLRLPEVLGDDGDGGDGFDGGTGDGPGDGLGDGLGDGPFGSPGQSDQPTEPVGSDEPASDRAGAGGTVGDVWDELFDRSNGTQGSGPAVADDTINSVDVSQHAGLASTPPTTQDLTSPHTPETSVSTYTDLEGRAATNVPAQQPGPCLICGVRCGVTFLGYRLHIPCFENSTEATRQGALQRTTGQQPVVQQPVVQQPVVQQPVVQQPVGPESSPVQEAAATEQPTEQAPAAPAAPVNASVKASPQSGSSKSSGRSKSMERITAADEQYAGPAAILDVDSIWMPDGTQIERPDGLRHVGHLAELVDQLRLGTQVTTRKAWPGQIWLTGPALAEFGVPIEDAELPEETRERGEMLRTLTRGTAFVDEAIKAGWSIGGAKDALATWTRVWRADSTRRGIWVALMPGMDDPQWRPDERMPLLADDPDPSALARRLRMFSKALHAPFTMSASTTGLDLMTDLRAKERDRMFTVVENLPWFAEASTTEGDINWSRKPTSEEAARTYLHAYDRGGSYAAGIAGLELPVGEPVHHPEGSEITFAKKTPGYWRVVVPEAGDWRMPNALNPQGRNPEQPVWLTTPAVEFALEQDYPVEILEAYVWPDHARVLDPWYDRIRDARTELDTEDPDAQVARTQLKAVYTFTIGMLGSEAHMKGRREYAPHRRHHIVAKARTNILRRVAQIGSDTDHWPVAISKDTILYVSDEPDPVKAWPGKPQQLGRGFGQYKPEASGLLADQLDYLTGAGYRGMKALKGSVEPDRLSD